MVQVVFAALSSYLTCSLQIGDHRAATGLSDAMIILLLAAWLLYYCGIIIHRLYFSPLAKFPGPKLAAATGWYEFYHDYWREGKYLFEIEKMHKKYGPIIRINPDELSIRDADFYNELYVTESKRRTNGHELFCKGIDIDGSHLLTVDHDLHRRRRKPLEPFFSRLGVSRLQPMLAEVAMHLESRIRNLKGTNTVIRLEHAFSAFAGDTVGRICFDDGKPGGRFLDAPDFTPGWYDMIHALARSIPLFSQFPFIMQLLSLIPEWVLLRAYPQGQMVKGFRQRATDHIRRAMATTNGEKSSAGSGSPGSSEASSLFHHIVASDMPESERSEERLAKEAQIILGAGTVTVSRTMAYASFYILSRPELRAELEAELREPMSDWPARVPTWTELERLPLLQAIIKESLRLTYGVMHRLPRVSPDVPIQFREYTIPPGIPVGMSAYLQHSDPDVFPSPDRFMPERWLAGSVTPAMIRNYVPFSRGSRNCLGMNLAMAEMSLILAVLYRPGGPEFELFETDESDVEQAHDFVVPIPRLTSKGMRVLVR